VIPLISRGFPEIWALCGIWCQPKLRRKLRKFPNRREWRVRRSAVARIAAVVAALALPLVMVPAGASAAAADPLVSRGKTVTASSVEAPGLEPEKAVDGNASTRWASAE